VAGSDIPGHFFVCASKQTYKHCSENPKPKTLDIYRQALQTFSLQGKSLDQDPD
jgi:hypothetical protein